MDEDSELIDAIITACCNPMVFSLAQARSAFPVRTPGAPTFSPARFQAARAAASQPCLDPA